MCGRLFLKNDAGIEEESELSFCMELELLAAESAEFPGEFLIICDRGHTPGANKNMPTGKNVKF